MNRISKKAVKTAKREIQNILDYYPAEELENTIFDVFEEANVAMDLHREEREKRKMLHEALRKVFRKITKTGNRVFRR